MVFAPAGCAAPLSSPLASPSEQIDVVDLWSEHTPWPYRNMPKSYSFLVKYPILWRASFNVMAPKFVHVPTLTFASVVVARQVCRGPFHGEVHSPPPLSFPLAPCNAAASLLAPGDRGVREVPARPGCVGAPADAARAHSGAQGAGQAGPARDPLRHRGHRLDHLPPNLVPSGRHKALRANRGGKRRGSLGRGKGNGGFCSSNEWAGQVRESAGWPRDVSLDPPLGRSAAARTSTA